MLSTGLHFASESTAWGQLTRHQRLTERLRLIAEFGVKPLLFGALLPVLLQGLAFCRYRGSSSTGSHPSLGSSRSRQPSCNPYPEAGFLSAGSAPPPRCGPRSRPVDSPVFPSTALVPQRNLVSHPNARLRSVSTGRRRLVERNIKPLLYDGGCTSRQNSGPVGRSRGEAADSGHCRPL